MKAAWSGDLETYRVGRGDWVIRSTDGHAVAVIPPSAYERRAEARARALVHRANAYPKMVEAVDAVRKIAAGYADAPCFTDLLGDELEHDCTCPSCGLRAVLRACALASTREEGE